MESISEEPQFVTAMSTAETLEQVRCPRALRATPSDSSPYDCLTITSINYRQSRGGLIGAFPGRVRRLPAAGFRLSGHERDVLHGTQAVDEVFSSCSSRAFRPNVAFLFATDNVLLSRNDDEPDASALLQAALSKYATARGRGRGHGTHTHMRAGHTHALTRRAPTEKILRSARAWTRAWVCGRMRARAWQDK